MKSFLHIAVLWLIPIFITHSVSAAPKIFWASDPVHPNETVMVSGADLGGVNAVVEIARLGDAPHPLHNGDPMEWTRVPVLQGSEETLKFVVPAAFKMGVFDCRVTVNGAKDEVKLNMPDVWWIQGDEGDSATPGGWLRIMGKSLNLLGAGDVVVVDGKTKPLHLQPVGDAYSLRVDLPATMTPGHYRLSVHNGAGANEGYGQPVDFQIIPARVAPTNVYSVLETYGPDAVTEMRQKTLVKYNQPLDRTEGILAALKKAKDNGGGIVYFPAGRYTVKGPLVIPEHTILRGEGEGLVTLWWGTGHFNLDGGGPQGRAKIEEPKPPSPLISGPDFAIEQMSLYLPIDYEQGIIADNRFRMDHVRIRIDHYWLVQGRGNGVVARLGKNFQVTDCDILAKGDGLVPGQYGLITHSRIMSNKSNTPMGNSRCVIIEDNQMVSMDPTAYQNIAGVGRNIYYGHNHHEALYAQQSDYSFTFDAGGGAYVGGIAKADGTQITLAADPTYPKWAQENSNLWKRGAIFILDGRGVGQWRDVISNHGRNWEIDRPFDVAPDATSVASIVPFNGRVLVIGNSFEDANWLNAGYGTSIDVICADNHLARCADIMNYGVRYQGFCEPSWHVQFFNNTAAEGITHISSTGDGHKQEGYAGPLTRWAIHRHQNLTADNSGSITLGGNLRDAIVENCTLKHPLSIIKVDKGPQGVVLRNNDFSPGTSPRYAGDGLKDALAEPPVQK
jgi:hypothetical protein